MTTTRNILTQNTSHRRRRNAPTSVNQREAAQRYSSGFRHGRTIFLIDREVDIFDEMTRDRLRIFGIVLIQMLQNIPCDA